MARWSATGMAGAALRRRGGLICILSPPGDAGRLKDGPDRGIKRWLLPLCLVCRSAPRTSPRVGGFSFRPQTRALRFLQLLPAADDCRPREEAELLGQNEPPASPCAGSFHKRRSGSDPPDLRIPVPYMACWRGQHPWLHLHLITRFPVNKSLATICAHSLTRYFFTCYHVIKLPSVFGSVMNE